MKTYDLLLMPTGETTSGDKSFPVSRKAIELYETGRFGHLFVSGGYGGLVDKIRRNNISEAEETKNFLLESEKIPTDKFYWDGQSLETIGNFTFPIVEKKAENPSLLDFKKILILGREGHMWRIKDYVNKVFSKSNNLIEFETCPGKHNSGLQAKLYHEAIMNRLDKLEVGSPEEIHNFLLKEHPFYEQNWYEKSPLRRKVETGIKVLN